MELEFKDVEKLTRLLKDKYTEEELKDFIARCFVERACLILSMGAEDGKDKAREKMIETLKELQTIATQELIKKGRKR